MKKLTSLALTVALALVTFSGAAQNVGIGGTVTNAQDELGVDIPGGVLTLLVVDAGDDGFGFLNPGLLQDDKFILGASDPDLYLSQMGTSINVGDGIALFPNQTLALGTTNVLGDSLSAGDNFYIVWFPDLAASTTNLTAGDIFGFARGANWELPSSGNIVGVTINGGISSGVVIPEPSTYALIVLGLVLVGGMRIRRRK